MSSPPKAKLRPKRRPRPKPDHAHFDHGWTDKGYTLIAGVDEAGRGCLAGPVVAAAVILPARIKLKDLVDSKTLTVIRRERLYDAIEKRAIAWAWDMVDAPEIDEINVLRASLKAMNNAIRKLMPQPHALLTDGNQPVETSLPQKTVVKGDEGCRSIAAASVMAKVVRDRFMHDCARRYPEFTFHIHKGYGTRAHLEELKRFGPTPIHRKTFRRVVF